MGICFELKLSNKEEFLDLVNDLKEKIEEEMFLGLRLLKGVDLNSFEEKYGKRAEKIFREVIDKNLKIGYLEIDDNKLRLTRKGLFYGNEVFSEFLLD